MRRAAELLLPVLLATACATVPSPPPRLPIPPASVAPLLERVRVEGEQRTSIRGLARVKVDSPEGSGRLREVIVLERPASVRLETLNLFGQTQALLITNGSHYVARDRSGLERGLVYDTLLGERLGLDFTVEEAVEALLAAPAIGPGEVQRAFAVGDQFWVETSTRRIRIGPEGELLGLDALEGPGRVRWAADYGRWREVEGGRYPFHVRLVFATGVEAEVSIREVELNPVLDPGLFELVAGDPR